jgi:predicted DNA-binding protein (MmcQ/YjbR family)
MTREEFEKMVLESYGVRADYPFEDDFETGVFRHPSGKWFALAMRISERKLGLESERQIDVVNLKCAPEVIESIAGVESGIYRAYHMNKTHWLTVALPYCGEDTVAWLLGISHELTARKITKRRTNHGDND